MTTEALRALARRGALLRIAELGAELESLQATVREIDGQPPLASTNDHEAETPRRSHHKARTRSSKGWTPERRAAQGRRARKYWRDFRKAGK